MNAAPAPTIGVFDSGFGGLTVLRALLEALPGANYLYIGDTARLPYGSKSHVTIARYATESANFLQDEGAQFLVIACNTASALALDDIKESVEIPVLGVIETGADAAAASSRTGDVIVLGTSATVQSHAYARALKERRVRTLEKACPLLVPLVEEGWIEHPVTEQVAHIYLDEALEAANGNGLKPDTLLLGCTHYPLLRPLLSRLAHETLTLIDSAEVTANRVRDQFGRLGGWDGGPANAGPAECRFFATDSVEKFQALGARFLGRPLDRVELIDLGG